MQSHSIDFNSVVEFPPLMSDNRNSYSVNSNCNLKQFIPRKGWKKCNPLHYIGYQVISKELTDNSFQLKSFAVSETDK